MSLVRHMPARQSANATISPRPDDESQNIRNSLAISTHNASNHDEIQECKSASELLNAVFMVYGSKFN
jgi:hypothetical protein